MFKVTNKDTRTTPMAFCISVSIVKFEKVNSCRVMAVLLKINLITDVSLIFFRI